MGALRTLVLLLVVLPLPGRAADMPLANTFASCAGRFSAEMEHAWLIADDRADRFKDHRAAFIDLLEAVVASDGKRDALNWRIEAKIAHADLLSRATFSNDADQSAWALRRASANIALCETYLLKS